jgi:hypothetical protein
MISLGAKVKLPKLKIDTPNKAFWQAVGITEAKEIHKTTLAGRDANGGQFQSYSKAYAKHRQSKGRSSRVNLTFTGRMLGSMVRGVRAAKTRVTIIMSGEQGFKASSIESGGREFFAISDKRATAIYNNVLKWMTKRNKLK